MSVPNAIQQDAIKNDIDTPSDDETPAAGVPSGRMAAMEAIANRNIENMRADGLEIDIDADIDTPAPETNLVEHDQLAAQLGQDERPSPGMFANEKMLVKVKVDGEELELPLGEVVKSYQKDATATRRLQDATQLLRIAEQKASTVAQSTTTPDNSAKPGEKPAVPDKTERLGKIKGAFSKLYEGDEDAAALEMLSLIEEGAAPAATAQPPIDPSQIAADVVQTLEVRSAYDSVRNDYPDLFASDERGVVLGKAAYERMQAKEQAGMSRSEALRESAEEIAALFGVQKAGRQPTEQPSTARDVKLSRKAQLDVPTGASVVAGGKVASAEDPNPSSTIAEMARSRLGQSMSPR